MTFHLDRAGTLPNSQSPLASENGAVMSAIMAQRSADTLVNIAHSRKFHELPSRAVHGPTRGDGVTHASEREMMQKGSLYRWLLGRTSP
jgi:hypothetical protein